MLATQDPPAAAFFGEASRPREPRLQGRMPAIMCYQFRKVGATAPWAEAALTIITSRVAEGGQAKGHNRKWPRDQVTNLVPTIESVPSATRP